MQPIPAPHIADWHCDLLSYLAWQPGRSALDAASGCSLNQLRAGGVALQIMPLFTPTNNDSIAMGQRQVQAWQQLCQLYPNRVCPLQTTAHLSRLHATSPIGIMAAIENASAFFAEDDAWETGLQRLETAHKLLGPLAYMSLTWNQENRFGGGSHSNLGLKPDGRRLIDWLAKHQIPLDLSHSSDALANDVFTYIHQAALPLQIIASHSNFRSCHNHPRNLPDHLARRIFQSAGIIGINLIAKFVGPSFDYLARHIAHATELGGEQQLVLGADFFYAADSTDKHAVANDFFFKGFTDASSLRQLPARLQAWGLSDVAIQQLLWQRTIDWLSLRLNQLR